MNQMIAGLKAGQLIEELTSKGVRLTVKLRAHAAGVMDTGLFNHLAQHRTEIVGELARRGQIMVGEASSSVDVLYITPAMAKEMLEKNTRNRPISEHQVKRYARLMSKGRWLLNCDAIGIDTNDQLVNGQHRLEAVVRSNTTQPMLVVTDLDPQVFEVSDAGKPRTAADVLASHGFSYYWQLSALAKILVEYRRAGRLHKSVTKFNAEISDVLELCEGHAKLVDSVAFATNLSHKGIPVRLVEVRFIALAHALYQAAHPEIEAWLEAFVTGVGLSATDSILVLRNVFLQDLQARAKLPPPDRLALIIIALNNKALGKEISALKWDEGVAGYYPQPVGVSPEQAFASWAVDDLSPL